MFKRFKFTLQWFKCKLVIYYTVKVFNPLPNNKTLEMTALKAFADDKLKVAKMMISLFDRVENTVGKGENAGYQHFPFFPPCFQKPSSLGPLKVGIMVKS